MDVDWIIKNMIHDHP